MKITPFQALTLLAKEYKNNPYKTNLYFEVKKLYLSGIRSEEDKTTYNRLLQDPILSGYEIAESKDLISNDPVRRYFESVLSFETLANSLDNLDPKLLKKNFDAMFADLPLKLRIVVPLTIYQNAFMSKAEKMSDTAREYAEAIRATKEKDHFDALIPAGPVIELNKSILRDRKNKLLLIAKTAHAGMLAVSSANEKYPLNMYGIEGSPFSGKKRGRKPREGQTVKSNVLGIMRSFMPLPQDDKLFAEKAAIFVRSPDRSTYIEGAEQPEQGFDTKVTPFVNSISGTVLCQLRIMAKFFREENFVYAKNNEQFKLYIKNLVSFLLFNIGGHSLDEFMKVLQLPQVREEFKSLPGFDSLTLEKLFKEENEAAFERAVEQTISYNDSILLRNELHAELTPSILGENTTSTEKTLTDEEREKLKSETRKGELSSIVKEDNLTTEARARLKKTARSGEHRGEELRISLFSKNVETLATRLDRAFEIYQNKDRTTLDRENARDFIIHSLGITNTEKDIDYEIALAIELRALLKDDEPDYVPMEMMSAVAQLTQSPLTLPPAPTSIIRNPVNPTIQNFQATFRQFIADLESKEFRKDKEFRNAAGEWLRRFLKQNSSTDPNIQKNQTKACIFLTQHYIFTREQNLKKELADTEERLKTNTDYKSSKTSVKGKAFRLFDRLIEKGKEIKAKSQIKPRNKSG